MAGGKCRAASAQPPAQPAAAARSRHQPLLPRVRATSVTTTTTTTSRQRRPPKMASSFSTADLVQMQKRPRWPPGASCSRLSRSTLHTSTPGRLRKARLRAGRREGGCEWGEGCEGMRWRGEAAVWQLPLQPAHAAQGQGPGPSPDAAVVAVDDQGPLALHVPPVAHLALAAAQVLGVLWRGGKEREGGEMRGRGSRCEGGGRRRRCVCAGGQANRQPAAATCTTPPAALPAA